MKIIFLDFDGVMNCDTTKDRRPHPLLPSRRVRGLDSDMVKRVSGLAAAAGAKVVISSTWRELFPLQELRSLLLEYGWDPDVEIIDITPFENVDPGQHFIYTRCERGDEIQAWLTKNGTPERFLVLDDMPTQFKDNHIQTDESRGFVPQEVDRALEILGGVK